MARILVIDDEQPYRDAIRRALMEDGHEVAEAPDGESGLRMFERENPQLTILDIHMPGMTGYEVLNAIRKQSREAKVLVISGSVRLIHTSLLDAARAIGASAGLRKPFENDVLLRTVRQMLAS